MKLLALPIMIAIGLAPTAARADKSYTSERHIEHDCATEADVSINVSGAHAVLTGACNKISVNGSSNNVTVATVKRLNVNGSKNTVAAGAVSDISATGVGNTITYKKSGKGPNVKSPGLNNKISEQK